MNTKQLFPISDRVSIAHSQKGGPSWNGSGGVVEWACRYSRDPDDTQWIIHTSREDLTIKDQEVEVEQSQYQIEVRREGRYGEDLVFLTRFKAQTTTGKAVGISISRREPVPASQFKGIPA